MSTPLKLCSTCTHWAKWYNNENQTIEGYCGFNGKPQCVEKSQYKPNNSN